MDKRQNNKKHNKNKQNNNKNKNINAQQTKVEQSNGQPTNQGTANKKPALSRKEKETLIQLKALLRQHSVKCQNPKEEWQQYEKIQEILHNIRQVEQPLPRKRNGPGSSEERLANIDKFYQWAKDNGLHSNGVDIQKFPEYDLGLMATKDIKKDDLLFSIPRKLILSEENLQCEKVCNIFPLSNVRLALALMIEFLKPDSFWKPYIDLLPDSYNTVLYYTVEEMAELKGSNALSSAIHQCQVVARYYLIISSMEFPLKEFNENFNYELFRWAISTVMTRENLIPRSELKEDQQEPERIASLIPFWDMANHRHHTISSYFNVETQEMESRAPDDFKKGEQVFIHYGDRSNADLMIHNGFINPDNPKDSVLIKLGLCPSDALYEKRLELLQLLNIPKNGELQVLPPPVYISSELLAFVRVFNMNKDQLEHWIKSERAIDLLHIDCALETELDSKTWQYLQIRLMLLLRAFPTTLEQDEGQFEKLKRNKSQRMYIKKMLLEYRILEKRILSAALDYAKQRTKV